VKRLTEERTRRSLQRYKTRRTTAADSFVKPKTEAEVIELIFISECERESIGA
jgi:hypothetical protein